jgi:hypothetical protein
LFLQAAKRENLFKAAVLAPSEWNVGLSLGRNQSGQLELFSVAIVHKTLLPVRGKEAYQGENGLIAKEKEDKKEAISWHS